MVTCAKCGTQFEGRFCPSCGAPAPRSGVRAATARASRRSRAFPATWPAFIAYLIFIVGPILCLVITPTNRDRKVRFDAFQALFLQAALYRSTHRSRGSSRLPCGRLTNMLRELRWTLAYAVHDHLHDRKSRSESKGRACRMWVRSPRSKLSRREALLIGCGRCCLCSGSRLNPDQAEWIRFFAFSPMHLTGVWYAQIGEIVNQLGFDGVDFTMMPGGGVEPSKAPVDEVRAFESVHGAGLECPIATTALISPKRAVGAHLARSWRGAPE